MKGKAEEYPGAFIEFKCSVAGQKTGQAITAATKAMNDKLTSLGGNLGIITEVQSQEDQFAVLEEQNTALSAQVKSLEKQVESLTEENKNLSLASSVQINSLSNQNQSDEADNIVSNVTISVMTLRIAELEGVVGQLKHDNQNLKQESEEARKPANSNILTHEEQDQIINQAKEDMANKIKELEEANETLK